MRIRTLKKNKSEILKTYLQHETDLTPKINEDIFKRFFDILEKNISDHLSIELRNFGVFKVKFMNSRFGSDPRNKKNYRTRCSALIKTSNENVLVDTSPDLRQQLLRHKIQKIDKVYYSHMHADQTHGINDLRSFFINIRKHFF